MKRTTMLALFALTWIMVPHSLLAQTNVAATITHLEQAWADAQKAGDAANVAPLLADNFINTDVDGNRSGKSELLSNLKAASGSRTKSAT
jgi:ketosteroid isomerase-like protein